MKKKAQHTPQAISLMADVGVALLNALREHPDGQSKRGLAEAMGYQQTAVSKAVSGRMNFTLSCLSNYARALGMHVKIQLVPGRSLMVRRTIDIAAKPKVHMEGTLGTIARAAFEPVGAANRRFSASMVRQVVTAIAASDYQWASYRNIADLGRVSEQTVAFIIPQLVRLGIVERNRRPARGTAKGVGLSRYLVRIDTIRRRYMDDPQTCIDKEGEATREDRRDSRGTDPSEEAA